MCSCRFCLHHELHHAKTGLKIFVIIISKEVLAGTNPAKLTFVMICYDTDYRSVKQKMLGWADVRHFHFPYDNDNDHNTCFCMHSSYCPFGISAQYQELAELENLLGF